MYGDSNNQYPGIRGFLKWWTPKRYNSLDMFNGKPMVLDGFGLPQF